MAKEWVLHTETKGTGAQMVPLESVTTRSGATQPVFVPREPVLRSELSVHQGARQVLVRTVGGPRPCGAGCRGARRAGGDTQGTLSLRATGVAALRGPGVVVQRHSLDAVRLRREAHLLDRRRPL